MSRRSLRRLFNLPKILADTYADLSATDFS